MSKDLPFFRFTVSEWLNDDISMEAYSLKGLFIDVCAFYWFKDCSITKAMLEKRFSNAKAEVKALLKQRIIKSDKGGNISILFLDDQYDMLSEKRKKRQLAGKKGGLSKSSNARAMLKQSSSYKDNNKNKDNNKEKNIIPPLFKSVEMYAKTRGLKVDILRFYDFYESKNWMVGKNKMKDWQAAYRTWEPQKKQENKDPFLP